MLKLVLIKFKNFGILIFGVLISVNWFRYFDFRYFDFRYFKFRYFDFRYFDFGILIFGILIFGILIFGILIFGILIAFNLTDITSWNQSQIRDPSLLPHLHFIIAFSEKRFLPKLSFNRAGGEKCRFRLFLSFCHNGKNEVYPK